MKNKKSKTKPAKIQEKLDDLEDVNMNEVTDSEDELSENERELLDKVRNRRSSETYDSDYEVYGLQNEEDGDDSDEEEDSMESDIEGLREDFDLPNEKAWGKKKKDYYSTDYVDADYSSISQKELATAEMEEEEARNIQKKLAEQLDDADFELDIMQSIEADDEHVAEKTEQFVKADLGKLSKRQKQAIMEKESPEFMVLVNDFKGRMTEVKDILGPFLKLAKNSTFSNCHAVSFAKVKYDILLNYCINISFYLMLKAKRLPVNSHPVIKRLAQYSQLLNQLEAGQGDLIQEIEKITKAVNKGEPLYNVYDGSKIITEKKKKSSKLKEKLDQLKKLGKKKIVAEDESESGRETEKKESLDVEDNSDDMSVENMESSEKDSSPKKVEEMEDANDPSELTEGKRGISYQIAKNKGLTPYRKKEQRNPRVKHRNKYRKAKIRRRGAVREVRKEITRYAGEISGIKATVKKSIKLK